MKQLLLGRLLSVLIVFTGNACKKNLIGYWPPLVNLLAVVLPEDTVYPNLQSLFYHFDYDSSGKLTFVSFASGLHRRETLHTANKIIDIRNRNPVNKDRIQ